MFCLRTSNGRKKRMSVSSVRYPVKLQSGQRNFLETMIHTSSTPTKHAPFRPRPPDERSESGWAQPHRWAHCRGALHQSSHRDSYQAARMSQENLEVALTGSFPRERPERRCLDGKGEAQLIHLACSKAPDGRQRWTLELLADQMVKLEYVEHISPETVRQALKKTNSSPGSRSRGVSPKRQTGTLCIIWRMSSMCTVSRMIPRCPGSVWMRWARIWSKTNIPPNQPNRDKSLEKTTRMRKRAVPICSLPMN